MPPSRESSSPVLPSFQQIWLPVSRHPPLSPKNARCRVLGFLDYFLKGFVNGGVFPEEFLLSWAKTRNCDPNHLRAHVVDIRKILKNSGTSVPYSTLRERSDEEDQTQGTSLEYLSAFRILGVLKSVEIDSDTLLAHPDFEVEYDLYPSAEKQAALGHPLNEAVINL